VVVDVVEDVVEDVVVDVVVEVVVVVGAGEHRRRPTRSGGEQMSEQQLASSRQILPSGRHAAAPASRTPTRPSALATKPPISRRREPD
jgi:hypothetical protein